LADRHTGCECPQPRRTHEPQSPSSAGLWHAGLRAPADTQRSKWAAPPRRPPAGRRRPRPTPTTVISALPAQTRWRTRRLPCSHTRGHQGERWNENRGETEPPGRDLHRAGRQNTSSSRRGRTRESPFAARRSCQSIADAWQGGPCDRKRSAKAARTAAGVRGLGAAHPRGVTARGPRAQAQRVGFEPQILVPHLRANALPAALNQV
jgi:hypothetical protein